MFIVIVSSSFCPRQQSVWLSAVRHSSQLDSAHSGIPLSLTQRSPSFRQVWLSAVRHSAQLDSVLPVCRPLFYCSKQSTWPTYEQAKIFACLFRTSLVRVVNDSKPPRGFGILALDNPRFYNVKKYIASEYVNSTLFRLIVPCSFVFSPLLEWCLKILCLIDTMESSSAMLITPRSQTQCC